VTQRPTPASRHDWRFNYALSLRDLLHAARQSHLVVESNHPNARIVVFSWQTYAQTVTTGGQVTICGRAQNAAFGELW